MEEGMTGLNPEVALRQIHEFFETVDKYCTDFWKNGAEIFMVGLEKVWCSPKAVEFAEKHFNKIYSIDYVVYITFRNICINAITAYNIVARANGWDAILYDDTFSPSNLDDINNIGAPDEPYELKEVNENGVVGMNHMQVKNLLSIFKTKVDELIKNIDTLPLDIAFYDPNGEMKAAYKQEITNLINRISSDYNDISTDINNAIETEINTMLLAKQEATDALTQA